MCSSFPCGVKTTHSAIFSTFLFIFSATDIQSFLSVQLETKLFLFFLFMSLNLTHMRSLTGSVKLILAQRDGHVNSSSSPSQFRAGCQTWHCCLQSHFLWSGQKNFKAFLLCESTAGNPHYTEGHQGFECVCGFLLHICSLLILTTSFVSILFLSFSALVLSAKVQKCVISQHTFFLVWFVFFFLPVNSIFCVNPVCSCMFFKLPEVNLLTWWESFSGGPCSCQCVVFGDKRERGL